jgi:hypothetical protein
VRSLHYFCLQDSSAVRATRSHAPRSDLRKMHMSSSHAASMTVAAAVVVALACPNIAAADTSAPEAPNAPVESSADPLDPAPRLGEHELQTAAMTKICDVKCQVLTFTEDTIPGLGASQILYSVLYPGKAGLSIQKADGTVAVKFTVMPTKLARGKALVAMGTF